MRHKKKGYKLNCNSSHRLSLFRNLSISLIKHEVIKTTLVKAKALRMFLEPIINISKVNKLYNFRLLISRLNNVDVVRKLFNDLGPRFKNHNGGYIRILKCGFRKGDCAPMAYIEILKIN